MSAVPERWTRRGPIPPQLSSPDHDKGKSQSHWTCRATPTPYVSAPDCLQSVLNSPSGSTTRPHDLVTPAFLLMMKPDTSNGMSRLSDE